MPGCQCRHAPPVPPFRQDAHSLAYLDAFNRRWTQRLSLFRARTAAPWWAAGLVLTADLRGRYEMYLPISEFCADLEGLGRRVLPHPSWVPRLIRTRQAHTRPASAADGPMSLPDLWALLPRRFAGRVTFSAEDLPALFCGLADSPRMGTDTERYPCQRESLSKVFASHRGRSLWVLDLACGVGLGTFEAFALAQRCGVRDIRACGVTIEPLEAWMAAHQCLPHDSARQDRLCQFAPLQGRVQFLTSDVRRLPLHLAADTILCNGLMGGAHFHDTADAQALLAACARQLVPDGTIMLANRFHDGRRQHLQHFSDVARMAGWTVSGDWRNLELRRDPMAAK